MTLHKSTCIPAPKFNHHETEKPVPNRGTLVRLLLRTEQTRWSVVYTRKPLRFEVVLSGYVPGYDFARHQPPLLSPTGRCLLNLYPSICGLLRRIQTLGYCRSPVQSTATSDRYSASPKLTSPTKLNARVSGGQGVSHYGGQGEPPLRGGCARVPRSKCPQPPVKGT